VRRACVPAEVCAQATKAGVADLQSEDEGLVAILRLSTTGLKSQCHCHHAKEGELQLSMGPSVGKKAARSGGKVGDGMRRTELRRKRSEDRRWVIPHSRAVWENLCWAQEIFRR